MAPSPHSDYIFLGKLTRDTIINAQGRILIDQPGGNLLYAAAGAGLYDVYPQLVARIGIDYPQDWAQRFGEMGFGVDGLRHTQIAIDQHFFVYYPEVEKAAYDDPIRHFGDLGQPLPKSLLGYQQPTQRLDSLKERNAATLRPEDLPDSYTAAQAAHLCGLDFLSHSSLTQALRNGGIGQITLAAGPGYMHPHFWNEVPKLVNGLSAFLASERQVRTLFSGRSEQLTEMAEQITNFNCAAVVIQRGRKGQHLFVRDGGRHYQIPSYPVQARDITGAGHAFGGGFAVGLRERGDPLEAALYGGIAASVTVEGSGAFYALEGSRGLAESRLEALRGAIHAL